MINYVNVILYLRPDAQVALVDGEAYENIDWGQEVPIDQADLDAAWPTVQAAKDAAEAARLAQAQADAADKAAIKLEAQVQSFINMTPAQVNNYIDTNVTDLASAKTVLKFYGRMLLLLARKEYKD